MELLAFLKRDAVVGFEPVAAIGHPSVSCLSKTSQRWQNSRRFCFSIGLSSSPARPPRGERILSRSFSPKTSSSRKSVAASCEATLTASASRSCLRVSIKF
jgi:hypothetical protein